MSTSRTTLSQIERHKLIEENLQLPRLLAHQKSRAVRHVSQHFDDVIADGFVGLVQAANAFDPSRGTFRTFAFQRVRGAIQDGGRRMGPYSRRHHASLAQTLTERHQLHVDVGALSSVDDETVPDPDDAIDRRRTLERTLRTVASLPERERQVLTSHYFSGRTIQETAAEIGLAEFTTCRLHTKAIRRLRSLLTGAAATTEQP